MAGSSGFRGNFAMSTPSTATATHPSHQRYGYSRHQVYHQPNPQSFPTASAASNALANPFSYTSNHQSTTNGLSLASTPKTTATVPSMASYSTPTVLPTAHSRRKQPDWGEFYKNGVPKEIIVIDDDDDDDNANNDPVPVSASAVTSTTRTAPRVAPSASSSNLPASKKRRTDASSGVDVYYERPAYSASSQKYGEGSSAAPSMSTDRTASIHTTAPTSLGSQASGSATNNAYLDDVAVGQKRKRVVTRKAARDELKRRELETVGDAFSSYIPPPKPPIKAKDVVVPVIRDV